MTNQPKTGYKPGDLVEVKMPPKKYNPDLDAWEWRSGEVRSYKIHMDGGILYKIHGDGFITQAPAHCMRLKPSEEA